MQAISNKEIRLFILKFFNDSELETFCFDYFPDVQNNFTIGMEKNNKIMQMMQYCRNRELMVNLLTNLQQEWPQPYQTTFSPQETVVPHASYAMADADELAKKLAADLRTAGHPVWMAPASIAPGEKWGEAIQRGLQESGIFLPLSQKQMRGLPVAAKMPWQKEVAASARPVCAADDSAQCIYQRLPRRAARVTGLQ